MTTRKAICLVCEQSVKINHSGKPGLHGASSLSVYYCSGSRNRVLPALIPRAPRCCSSCNRWISVKSNGEFIPHKLNHEPCKGKPIVEAIEQKVESKTVSLGVETGKIIKQALEDAGLQVIAVEMPTVPVSDTDYNYLGDYISAAVKKLLEKAESTLQEPSTVVE